MPRKNKILAVAGFKYPLSKNFFLRNEIKDKVKTTAVVGLEREKATQEYVLFRNEALVLLAGSLGNQNTGRPLLLDRDFWLQLPHLRWRATSNSTERGLSISARNNGVEDNLSGYLAEYLGLEARTALHPLGNPLDRRRLNLTTSNIGACYGDGKIGMTSTQDRISVQTGQTASEKSYLGSGQTDLIGQQLYNAILLNNKMQKVDLRCLGRVEEKGRILNMFPDSNFPLEKFIDKYPFLEDYYTVSGTLKPKYRPTMREHKHLVAPFTDKNTVARLKYRGTDLDFTCLSRTPFNK